MRRIFLNAAYGALLLIALNCSAANADVEKAIAAYQRRDYATAFAEFSIAAGKDDAFSQNVLGTMYAQGHGVERNYKLAMDWFFKAQALGSTEAMSNLAKMYESGLGVPQNNMAALQYYGDAARAGFQPAITRMIEIYSRGELGVTPDLRVVLDWRDRLRGPQAAAGPAVPARPVPPAARASRKQAVNAALPQAARRDEAAQPQFDQGALHEQQLMQRLTNYRQSERKLFVASTDNIPSLAAYLKELRTQLKSRLASVFSSAKPDDNMIVTLAILRDGSLKDIELSQASGNRKTDARVLASLKQLARLKPLPAETSASAEVLMVSVRLPID